MRPTETATVMPAEWYAQDGILMAWPHAATDWAPMLDEVQACYRAIVRAIVDGGEDVLLVAPLDPATLREQVGIDSARLHPLQVPTNDTWTRDYGPITILRDGEPTLLDFKFNAWGLKFAAHLDNCVTSRLTQLGAWRVPVASHLDLVLEGGSIESDGEGTIMTTTCCLVDDKNRNAMSREQLTHELQQRLGAKQVLWVDHGHLDGDDTDGHIDTLARFAPGGTIIYCRPGTSASDEDLSLQRMEQQLSSFTDAAGRPYRLVGLPKPQRMVDDEGEPLPATYANFLITNSQVLVPTYAQPELDREALDIIAEAFPHHRVQGIDCRALVKQHGSLHCATMQLPRGTLAVTDAQ